MICQRLIEFWVYKKLEAVNNDSFGVGRNMRPKKLQKKLANLRLF